MVLLAPAHKIPKDRSWNNAKLMMTKVLYVVCIKLCGNVHMTLMAFVQTVWFCLELCTYVMYMYFTFLGGSISRFSYSF